MEVPKNMIVVGCGRVGAELAYRLFHRGYQVSVLDQDAIAFNRLHLDFRGRIFAGELLSRDLLHRAGIETAFGLASVTTSDSLNAVVARTARLVYNVPKVVVRNYDPAWRSLLETFGLQIVGSSSWGAQRIEELLTSAPAQPLFAAGNGEVAFYEVKTPSAWRGRSVQDIHLGCGCVVSALTRAGRAIMPVADTLLEANDLLYLTATPEAIESLRQYLAAED